jgi:hypothetical protein
MLEAHQVSKEPPAFVAFLAPIVFIGCLFGLLFSPEDVLNIFLRNVSEFPPDYTALLFIGPMLFLSLNHTYIWVT